MNYMKTSLLWALCTVSISTFAADLAPSAYQVVNRDANSRVWERQVVTRTASGQATTNIQRYTELATGLNYKDTNGQWVASRPQITLTPRGGAEAIQGQHKVYFPPDIYNAPLEVVTPDGKHLRSRPLFLGYDDGKLRVMIAQLKHSIGTLVNSNQMMYPDAFTDIKADLLCTYRKSGFECDIIFREQPSRPESFGLDSSASTIQLFTEFYDTADPKPSDTLMDWDFGLVDSTLKFGALTMGHGKAFATSTTGSSSSSPVYKTWAHLQGRTFLIEELPLPNIKNELASLPPPAGNGKPSRHIASANRILPPSPQFAPETNQIQVASIDLNKEPGVVLDWSEVVGGADSYTFTSGMTYLVNGPVGLGCSVVFEGGAVIKYTDQADWGIELDCDPSFPSDTDQRVIFTSMNDDSVGDPIETSTGNPTTMNNVTYLQAAYTVENVEMHYAGTGIVIADPAQVTGSRFFDCNQSISMDHGDINILNCLFVRCGSGLAYTASSYYWDGNEWQDWGNWYGFTIQNITADQPGDLVSWPADGINMQEVSYSDVANSIFTGITDQTLQNDIFIDFAESRNNAIFPPGTVPPYVSAAKADYYIAPNSTCHHGGTSDNLLVDLHALTTYAPQDGSHPDNTGTPDLGYHYPINEDSDHDGLPDWWELKYFGGYGLDGTADPDNDGHNNLYEYQHGTVPASLPAITIQASTPTANENGPVPGVFTITRTAADISSALNVDFALSGTATAGSDYVLDTSGGVWTEVQPADARAYSTATLLNDGNVLVAGGLNPSLSLLASAQIYHPSDGTWTTANSMSTARYLGVAVTLADNRVLVIGGHVASAELFNPADGTWASAGSMSTARMLHTATVLPDGKVLVAGGSANSTTLQTAEIYDPVAGTWTTTGSMTTPRQQHTATLLPNGKVLVAGGMSSTGTYLSSAEIYDPATGVWTATGGMPVTRDMARAILLPNGKVLLAGGRNSTSLTEADLYDYTTGTWTATGAMAQGRYFFTFMLLPTGKVLAAGGGHYVGSSITYLADCELYDPVSGTWTATGSMKESSSGAACTLMPDSKVLIVGGYGAGGALSGAEIFDPFTVTIPATSASAMISVVPVHYGDQPPGKTVNLTLSAQYPFTVETPSSATVYVQDADYNLDTDGDGIADGWERQYFGGLNIAGYGDADGDGLTDIEEFKLGTDPLTPNVAAPVFDPPGGHYDGSQQVYITSPTEGAVIHYTLNGADPTEMDPVLSSGDYLPIGNGNQGTSLRNDGDETVLRAKAWKSGWIASDTEEEGYDIGIPNESPSITISPPDGSSFLASDSVDILVDAEDSDGSIYKIQLFRGDLKIAETTTVPLRYSLDFIPAGTYTFTAKAIDNQGAVTASDPITITINDSGPAVSLVGEQPIYTSSPATLLAGVTGMDRGALTSLTLNGNTITPRVGQFNISAALTEGENTFTLVATDDQSRTATATTKVYLDTVAPVIAITAPATSSSFSTARINVTGTFTETSLKQITVNGIVAFTSGNTFEALNVPLAEGANTITATAVDLAGNTSTTSVTVTGSATPVAPVQLAATPVGGFATLPVTFTPTASVPGTLQHVYYDFDGDGVIDQTETTLSPVTHSYSEGQYFPVVTVQTTSGRFSSIGGWNSSDPSRLRINVQAAPTTDSSISVTDPVDLKVLPNGDLLVLSGSTATLTEYDSGGTAVRSLSDIGTDPSGLDVDSFGNIYVVLSGDNQVARFIPNETSFEIDESFGNLGYLGNADKSSGQEAGMLYTPTDVAVSPDRTQIAVSDTGNDRIQIFDIDGNYISMFGETGSDPGQFNLPKGLAYDAVGYLYVVDFGNDRVVLALDSTVLGTSGTTGSALGQFDGALNLAVGNRGIYVADAGNDRVEVFDPLKGGHGAGLTELNARLELSTQFSTALHQPGAIATIADFLTEKIYVADTGNNRVLKVTLPRNVVPDSTCWSTMKTQIAAGNINNAVACFSSVSADKYREAFLSMGTSAADSILSDIPTLSPVAIEGDTAQYRFDKVIDGVTITFPVEFVKENGQWKIMEY